MVSGGGGPTAIILQSREFNDNDKNNKQFNSDRPYLHACYSKRISTPSIPDQFVFVAANLHPRVIRGLSCPGGGLVQARMLARTRGTLLAAR
eukprot:361503-Pyramimonas_sp.AAC.1